MTTVRARRTTTLLLAGLLPLTLAACGVGRDPQTYKERTTTDAANADVGDLALRDVAILPPAGASLALPAGSDALGTLSIVNSGDQADTLSSVTTAAARSVQIVDRTGHPVTELTVPRVGSLGSGDFGLVLHGLTAALRPGTYVSMTFAFTRDGQTTLNVPVKVYSDPLPRDSFSPQPATE